MGAVVTELQFSFCRAQLASNAGECSNSKSRSGQNCSAVGFRSISEGSRRKRLDAHRLLALSSGLRWLPLTQAQGWKSRGRDRGLNGERGGEGGISDGKAGTRARRSATVRMATGQLNSPKPTFVPLEMITGEESFDKILSEAVERNQPVVIDWLAAWCRKCIYLKPKLEKLAAEFYPDIKFYYIDVNTVPQSLVKRAEVAKMPTIQLWKDGKRLAEVIGGHQVWLVLDEVREMIKTKR